MFVTGFLPKDLPGTGTECALASATLVAASFVDIALGFRDTQERAGSQTANPRIDGQTVYHCTTATTCFFLNLRLITVNILLVS